MKNIFGVWHDTDTGSELDRIYVELSIVKGLDEESVKRAYNADSKAEVVLLIEEEIAAHEEALREREGFTGCPGIDYDALCSSQGLARFA